MEYQNKRHLRKPKSAKTEGRANVSMSSQSRGAVIPLNARCRDEVLMMPVWHSQLGGLEAQVMRVLTNSARLVARDI